MAKFLRILSIAVGSLAVGGFALYASVLVILNTHPVQQKIIAHLNENQLKELHTRLTLRSVGLSLAPLSLTLNGVSITRTEPEARTAHLDVAHIKVTLSLWESYVKRTLVTRGVEISGCDLVGVYDKDGHLVFPFLTKEENESTEPVRIKSAYIMARKYFPDRFQLSNVQLKIGQSDAPEHPFHSLHVDLVSFQKGEKHKDDRIAVVVGKYEGKIGHNHAYVLDADKLEIQATVSQVGSIALRTGHLIGSGVNLLFSGEAQLTDDPKLLPYDVHVKGQGDLKRGLGILKLDAQGLVSFTGIVSSERKSSLPQFDGRVKWGNNAHIEGYALYQGEAEVHYSGTRIRIPALSARTKEGGKLQGSGNVLLGDPVRFSVDGALSSFGFQELMAGIKVPTNAVSFAFQAPRIKFDGLAGGGQGFRLAFSGPVEVSNFTVPSFHTKTRTPVPNCAGSLSLIVDSKHLDLTGTNLSCNPDKRDTTVVKEGTIDFSSGKVLFDLATHNLAVHNAEYFLMDNPSFFSRLPTTGTADLTGRIFVAKSGAPLEFTSRLTGRDVRLYGVDYAAIEGNWGISSQMVYGDNIRGRFGSNTHATVDLHRFEVHFDKNVSSSFVGTVDGSLSAIFAANKGLFPDNGQNIPAIEGTINRGTVSIQLPIVDPSTDIFTRLLHWNTFANIHIRDLSVGEITANSVDLQLNCLHEVCTESRALLENISNNSLAASQRDADSRFVLVDVRKLSHEEADIRGQIQGLPIQSFTGKNSPFSATLSGRFELLGPWKTWRGTTRMNLDAIQVGGLSLGAFDLFASSSDGKVIHSTVSGQYGQVLARLRMPHDLKGPGSAYVWLKGFDPTVFLPMDMRTKYNVMTTVDAEATLEGPAPLTPETNGKWYENWTAQGQFQEIFGIVQQVPFRLREKAAFAFRDQEFRLSPLTIDGHGKAALGTNSSVNVEGIYDLKSRQIGASAKVKFNLGTVPLFLPQVSEADGVLNTEVEIAGTVGTKKPGDPPLTIAGTGNLSKGELLLRDYPPALRNIELDFAFDDESQSLRIRRLWANKGEGSVDVRGLVNWSAINARKDELPAVKMHVNLNKAQTRVPIPILQSLDTEADASLDICRQYPCGEVSSTEDEEVLASANGTDAFLIEGNIRLKDARMSREFDCGQIVSAASSSPEREGGGKPIPLRLNLLIDARDTVSIATKCARARLGISQLRIIGPLDGLSIYGRLYTVDGTGWAQFRNLKYSLDKASLEFEGRPDNPHYIAQLTTQVPGTRSDGSRLEYHLSINAEGRVREFRQNPPEIRADPPTHPDGQRPLTQTELVAMILFGRGPDASSPGGLSTELLANQVATLGTNAIFSQTNVDNSVSLMFRRLSAGYIDRVAVDPVFEAGKPKFVIRATMMPVENVSVNVQTDQDPSGTGASAKNGSLNAQWLLNNRINLGLDLRIEETQGENFFSMGSGIVFQFGGE